MGGRRSPTPNHHCGSQQTLCLVPSLGCPTSVRERARAFEFSSTNCHCLKRARESLFQNRNVMRKTKRPLTNNDDTMQWPVWSILFQPVFLINSLSLSLTHSLALALSLALSLSYAGPMSRAKALRDTVYRPTFICCLWINTPPPPTPSPALRSRAQRPPHSSLALNDLPAPPAPPSSLLLLLLLLLLWDDS